MQPNAHLDTECLHRVADRHGASDRSLRAVEHREEAVSRGVHLADRKRLSCTRTMASWASSKACQSRSPISAARLVESTMSVKSTVARTRSSATSAWCPVRNSAISWKDSRHGSTKWYTLRPGSSTYFAPEMRSATSLPHSGGMVESAACWRTRVGTRI